MSIYGVSNSSAPNIGRAPLQRPLTGGTGGTGGTRAPMPQQQPTIVRSPAAPAPKAAPAGSNAVPAEPPPGTDPALWSVLSSDERAFFAKAGAMGPLTYGRAFEGMRAQQLPASRGGRLDVKV